MDRNSVSSKKSGSVKAASRQSGGKSAVSQKVFESSQNFSLLVNDLVREVLTKVKSLMDVV
jgi:hypothetical protein